jgi:hypothetical protein
MTQANMFMRGVDIKMKRINVLVDFGDAFTHKNGSFYCGTTEEQKDNAVLINQNADETIYLSDVHSRESPEFLINGGLYPAHNLILRDSYDLNSLGVEEGKTVSPQLTEKLYNQIKDRKSGLIVPRHVFFQNYNGEREPKPAFQFKDIEKTFGVNRLDSQEYLDGGLEYIVNAKHMFNGAALQATDWMSNFPGVPDKEMNIFSLVKQKYGQGEKLKIDITGVVMGICVYQTAAGIRQILPKAEINVIADACTHLVYAPLGFSNENDANTSAKAMCSQIGVNYLNTKEYLGK